MHLDIQRGKVWVGSCSRHILHGLPANLQARWLSKHIFSYTHKENSVIYLDMQRTKCCKGTEDRSLLHVLPNNLKARWLSNYISSCTHEENNVLHLVTRREGLRGRLFQGYLLHILPPNSKVCWLSKSKLNHQIKPSIPMRRTALCTSSHRGMRRTVIPLYRLMLHAFPTSMKSR